MSGIHALVLILTKQASLEVRKRNVNELRRYHLRFLKYPGADPELILGVDANPSRNVPLDPPLVSKVYQ